MIPTQREEVVEFLKVWEEDFEAWKRTAEIERELKKKRWSRTKFFRWLRRLKERGFLLEKVDGNAKFYRPVPITPGKFSVVRKLIHVERILKNLKDLDVHSEASLRTHFFWGSMGKLRGQWMGLPLDPFWEYNTSLSIIGFPREEDLLPAERIVLEHITSKLIKYFKWLSWLRVNYLARRLLGVQLPLEDDLKQVVIERAIDEGYHKNKLIRKLQKLQPKDLTTEVEKSFKRKIEIPKAEKDVNIWSLLRELREKGHASDLAVILSSGPTKAALTDRGIGTNVEDGIPLPPLNFPDKEESKWTSMIWIQISGESRHPGITIKNPYPFAVEPSIRLSGYEYKLEEIRDKEAKLKLEQKAKKGEIPVMAVYSLQDILKELRSIAGS